MRTVDPATWRRPARSRRTGPRGWEGRLRASWWDAAREGWARCSVPLPRRARAASALERWHHGVVLLACVCGGALSVASRAGAVRGVPAQEAARHDARASIRDTPFPAVALCSNCVITRRALDNYTSFLLSRGGGGSYSPREVREGLLQFGALLTLDQPAVDVAFMEFVARADPTLNVTRLMAMFASPCKTMLKRCSWRSKIQPCDRLFATRLTPLGFCCVFNSRYYDVDAHRPPKYLDIVGQHDGLTVIVYEDPDDFAFVRRASVGIDVLVFDGAEYPLLEGGGVRLYPLEQNTSVLLSVSAVEQRPAGPGVCGGRRGHAACLTECRRRTLASVCGCRLHTLPARAAGDAPVCSVNHLPCLNKHREKLTYYYPGDEAPAALAEEAQIGQVCACAPDCARRRYLARASNARYVHTNNHKLFRRRITVGAAMENSTVLRLFYSSEHHTLYTIEATLRWYETFANLSNLWYSFTGVALVCGSELVFCFSVRWAHHYRRRTRARDLGPRLDGESYF